MCRTIKQKVRFKAPPLEVYRLLVQAWREREFPVGIFSMATFNLSPTAQGGTELILTHRGVPKDLIPRIIDDWRELYWEKMKRHLE